MTATAVRAVLAVSVILLVGFDHGVAANELEEALSKIGKIYEKTYRKDNESANQYKYTFWTQVSRGTVVCDRRTTRDLRGPEGSALAISTCDLSPEESVHLFESKISYKPSLSHTVVGYNPRYLFYLEGGKSGQWMLKGLMSRPGNTIVSVEQASRDAFKKVADIANAPKVAGRSLIDPELVCPGAMHVRKLALFTRFVLKDIVTDPSLITIQCEHDYGFITADDVEAGRKTPIPGRAVRSITLDRGRDNLPVRDEMVVKLSDGSTYTATSIRTIKTLSNKLYDDEYTHSISKTSQTDKLGEITIGRRTIELIETPPEKFYLSAFGLPEPEGLGVPDFQAEKRQRRWLYAGLAAAASGGLAVLIRFRRRRAAGAP